MGLRGPIRNPNSVRGRREASQARKLSVLQADQKEKRLPTAASETPEPAVSDGGLVKQPGLTPIACIIWDDLVAKLIAAEVPVKGIDSYALSMAASCLAAVQEWQDFASEAGSEKIDIKDRLAMAKLKQKFQTDAQVWLDKLGATPQSRLRMGIKPVVKKQVGAIAQLLAARRSGKRVEAA